MRISVHLDDELGAGLDERAGPGRRDAFIAELIRRGLDYERRWDEIEASIGTIADTGPEWDE
jgi:metal-responsive CopG/Arc/MetJ family transcriptional regulator